jgi:hypothetical protein
MRSISSALAANGVWYVLFGLFLMFAPGSLASGLGLGEPNHADFYIAFGAASMIGLGVALASLARNFTPAAVGGAVLANFIVILTILYWLLIVKLNLTTTGAIILWAALILLVLITVAESTSLNSRRRLR